VTHRRIFSEKTCTTMRELLTKSIKDAKTSTVRLDGIDVAGKTGTSRKPNANGRGYSPNVFTSFVGFFPAQAPKVLIMVVVDSPQMAEAWGSTVAGPIFHNIAEETVSYLGLNPIKVVHHENLPVAMEIPAAKPTTSPTSLPAQNLPPVPSIQSQSAVTKRMMNH